MTTLIFHLKKPFVEKARLIKSDPITCARYFDHRIRELLKLIKHKKGIFKNNKCIHFYWRVEVQQRGSLHLHWLFWLENAPVFGYNYLKVIL